MHEYDNEKPVDYVHHRNGDCLRVLLCDDVNEICAL